MKRIIKHKDLLIFLCIILILSYMYFFPKKRSNPPVEESANYISNPHEIRRDKDLLKVSINTVNNPLNPFYESTITPSLITSLINQPLFTRSEDGSLVPALAKSYWLEDDGRTVAVVLKEGLKFESGAAIDSESVLANYRVISDPEYTGMKSVYSEKIAGYFDYKKGRDEKAFGAVAEGKTFLKFHFNKASKDNLMVLELPILDLSDVEYRYGDLSAVREKSFKSGSGMYRVQNASTNKFLLEKRDEEADIVENICIELNPYFAAKSKYKAGSLDILYKYDDSSLNSRQLDEREKDYTKLILSQSNNYYSLGMNIQKGIFKDKNMRLALRDTIDFNEIFDVESEKAIKIPMYKNSRFLLENGYKDSGYRLDTYMSEVGLDNRELSLALSSSLANGDIIGEKLKGEFKKYGINLSVNYLSDMEMFDILDGNHDYDMFVGLSKMFVVPSVENQGVFNRRGEISSNAIEDYDIIDKLKWIAEVYGDENYGFAIEDWQRWYYENVPYIPIAVNEKVSLVNIRFGDIVINEFVGLDNPDNLKRLNILK